MMTWVVNMAWIALGLLIALVMVLLVAVSAIVIKLVIDYWRDD